ncbi:MAG: hypothetical protein A2381_12955 [Bdellovibrionales bacterium RIFOXYB1_FULL_37_110]|nr:MAG: hypothetical protein A2181_02280 [Bdellovibrionales bacterium RIFOXYA1_FULL_38_20]OFZ51616.1 MAG: hypothetical protein A2417_12615 [Bdellovibrionales bacterium RIFOXYC1_FULL_37_79]OFZ60443.1 MAG: hypothetical protein A2381_12955 [Bdellovibrionales bacterium RIFOXYB1_FULL_37_110]OFZ65016.1 MAG: hypothetical protein A2577_09220 [Bdellovibrionales bacterium RIFOXYD1_FULL_36_51]
MMNENLFKHSILLDLSLSLSTTSDTSVLVKNVLIKIIRSLNCSSGSIYMINRISSEEGIIKKVACIPYAIDQIEENFDKIIAINHEYKLKTIHELLESFPLTLQIENQSYYHFLPLPGLGFIFLETKEKPIENSFLKMLNPILIRITDIIFSNFQRANLMEFRNLFEAVDDYIVMYDRKLDQILDGNISFWSVLKRSENPPLYESIKKFLEINNSSDISNEIEYIQAKQKITANFNMEGKIITPQKEIPVSIRILSKSEDNTDKIAFIMKDLSIKEELEKQKSVFEAGQRLVGLGEMAGNIAHEINNPLAIIAGAAKLLELSLKKVDLPNAESMLSQIEYIEKATQRMSTIITSLKRVSRDGSLEENKITPIYEIIHDALDLSNHRLKQNTIKLEYDQKNFKINCKLTQISQIIVNLLNNSIYAVKTLSERWIKIEEEETQNTVRIRITDSGNGIPEETQIKMMHKYFTSKPAGEGTGIGLSLSREIMLKHNGILFYDKNCPNTSFVLEFPSI